MKTPFFVLLRKDLTLFVRNRAALVLTFVVPFVMIWVFGQVFGLNKTDAGPSGIPLAVVNQSDDPAAKAWLQALQAEKALRIVTTVQEKGVPRPLREEDLRARIEAADYNFALVIPADFLSNERFGVRLRLLSNPRNEIETQMVNGLLQKTLFGNVRTLFGRMLQNQTRSYLGPEKSAAFQNDLARTLSSHFGLSEAETRERLASGDLLGPTSGASTSAANGEGGDFLSRLVKIETEQVAGKEVKSPQATRVVSGFAMQFLLFALSAGATALLQERDQGLYHRLLAAPVARYHILLSRFVQGIIVGVVQLMVLFLASQLLFGTDVVSHLPLLLLVSVFAAATCAAFGMLIASLAPTLEAASGLATLTILTMSAVGGAWFPLSLMPEFMQQVAKFTLVYWAMRGFDLVLWNQTGLVPLLGTLGILAGIAAGVMAIAVFRFSRSRIFG